MPTWVRILTCLVCPLLAFFRMQYHAGALMTLVQKTAEDEDAIPVIILCIDAEVRDRIAYWLKFLPVRTSIAESGYQANKILRDVGCRLLITDRLLPPWPGMGRFHRLLVKRPGLRIAFIDDGAPDRRWFAQAFGATDFMPWPQTRRLLLELLVRVEAVPETAND